MNEYAVLVRIPSTALKGIEMLCYPRFREIKRRRKKVKQASIIELIGAVFVVNMTAFILRKRDNRSSDGKNDNEKLEDRVTDIKKEEEQIAKME